MAPYKDHFVCIPCRFHAKHDYGSQQACPGCRQPMIAMGLDFKAPRKRATNQWKKLQILIDQGLRFKSCGCKGPGWRPKTLGEARRLEQAKSKTPEEQYALLLKYGRAIIPV